MRILSERTFRLLGDALLQDLAHGCTSFDSNGIARPSAPSCERS